MEVNNQLSLIYRMVKPILFSFFGTNETLVLYNDNIEKSLLRITDYIRSNKLMDNTKADILAIAEFG